ncbi:MAG: hypothetical protein N4A35_06875 [Flavobacteriales bacterium]|jgi:hypothetical protein|nr:hypothetical protein [Flavobacteriales bacterium]
MKRIIFFFFMITSCIQAAVIEEKLYILGDSLAVNNGSSFPYLTFNASNSFSINNPVIELAVNDVLELWIVNFDSVPHSFEIKGVLNSTPVILAGDSIQINHQFTDIGAFIYYDPTNYPQYSYAGLSGLIAVHDSPNNFFWNLKTHQSSWNTSNPVGIHLF